MLKKIISIQLLITLSCALAYNQEEKSSMAIAWYPQLMFIRGLRADIDIHLGNSKSWFVLSPQYYLAIRQSGDYYESYDSYSSSSVYKELEGFGIEFNHRVYINNNSTPEGVYMSYGVKYCHFDLIYEDLSWGTINYLEMNAITYGLFEHNTSIDKMGPNFLIGYQQRVLDNIFIDIFCGGGMRYSFINTSTLFPRNFDNDFMQFGYTGTVPLAGFRIGIMLR